MKPICVNCQRFFHPKKNGFYFIEGMPTENGAEPGSLAPHKWKPYKLWSGDLWECKGCGAEIIVGTGKSPLGEHYQETFEAQVKSLGADFQVNDC